MHPETLITDLALILTVAGIVTLIFRKLKQPVVLGYLIAGFLISPNFIYIPTVIASEDIVTWADIGVIFLMFGLGLEFSFIKLAKVGGSAFTVVAIVMAAMILVGTGVGYFLGWGKFDCIFLGGMISISSTMIILKTYEEYNLKKEKFAQLILGALVLEDIAGIFMLIILPAISVGQNVSGLELAGNLGLMVVYLAAWLIAGIYLVPSIMKKIGRLVTNEILVILSIAFCLVMVLIANVIGFSSALGAFLAGSILASTKYVERIEHLVGPVKDLFGAVFFVSVGMLIDPVLLVKYIVPIIIISITVILGQMVFSTFGILLSGQSLKIAVRGGFSMVQIGEFSFIIATLGMNLGVISDFLYPIIVCVSVITSFATPVMVKSGDKVYSLLEKKLPKEVQTAIRKNTSESQSKITLDKDWNVYIKSVAVRTLLCSLMMFMVYWVGTEYMTSAICSFIDSEFAGKIVSAVIMIIVMMPFANYMHKTRNANFVKLWVKHRSNHLPLLTLKALRILIAACFVALVIKKLFAVPFIIMFILSLALIIPVVKSNLLNGVTMDMERRFTANFAQNILDKQKHERKMSENYRWLDESLYVIEFEITDADYNETIYEFTARKTFVVTIIRIIRNGEFINLPPADFVVQSGDIMQMLGTWDEVDSCTILLEDDDCIRYTDSEDMILKDYIYSQVFHSVPEKDQLLCVPIEIKGDSPYIRKSIKNSRIRNKYRGTIIGIERGNLPIVSPDIDTIIRKGDILWLMGDYKMVDRLIMGGLMDE
ncbi:MAG: cation:proton antiporter [Firmicutes bacterium]|nr:cation:proton antiporter [Bacillota bacterium]